MLRPLRSPQTLQKYFQFNEVMSNICYCAGTTHSVRVEEQLAFSDWINTNLGSDQDLTHILPLADSGLSLYDAVKDGILLCKIVNHSCPDTVDERVIDMKPNSVYKR